MQWTPLIHTAWVSRCSTSVETAAMHIPFLYMNTYKCLLVRYGKID